MNTQELLGLFHKYYEKPEEWCGDLFNGLKDYSFDNYDLFLSEMKELRPSCKSAKLEWQWSNTRTTRYLFGPPTIKKYIEDFLRFSEPTDRPITIWDDFSETIKSEEDVPSLIRLNLSDVWFNWETVSTFIKRKSFSKCFIYGHPYSLHQMTANEEFLESIAKKVHGFVNTDMPAFCKTSLLPKYQLSLNDQMINWKTGCNFYTCGFGYKHFLPIFLNLDGKCHNLVNIINRMPVAQVDDDDIFETTGSFEPCSCGKPRCGVKFISHSKNFLSNQDYDDLLSLRNSLSSRFRWIQFVEENDRVNVLFQTSQNSELLPDDKDQILAKIPNALFKRGESLKIGVKYPCFWRK